ncbi:MAG: hypothetical protein ABUL44_03560 [Flavobacterium sp.]
MIGGWRTPEPDQGHFYFMIVRKYTDDDGAILEISISENKKILFQSEYEGTFASIELDYKDVKDIQDVLYSLIKEIEPKEKAK